MLYDWPKSVTSRVFTSHVIQRTGTIFELNSHIKETNKNAPPTGGHVCSPIWSVFELVRDINKSNVLTNFLDDWAKIVTSRVFTRKTAHPGSHETNVLTKFHENWVKNVTSRVFTKKNAPPTGGHVFSPIWTIFELVRDINQTNLLTNFHDEWAKIVTSRVFTSFELDRDIIGTNLLTKFHEDPT
ncbi:hypothetical protein DPMN_116016 [Dreissena polymorpha]|uniref:Uncharacterized protein n=1 Tax=Dreissena polymorpha TaxID=45954 RepID=A0A9D4QUB3_DREPO|nr:hypothetical protein DPMN_116016 [Dreissena polymorpha]